MGYVRAGAIRRYTNGLSLLLKQTVVLKLNHGRSAVTMSCPTHDTDVPEGSAVFVEGEGKLSTGPPRHDMIASHDMRDAAAFRRR